MLHLNLKTKHIVIMKSKFCLWVLLLVPFFGLDAQEKEASPFDFGRMWTFENPPTEWFQEAYDFDADEAWFDDVRKSSLRFATWCSASFVSENGLIMTNHHCSRGEAIKVQQESENFDVNGFYAASEADERKVEGLFVEQLLMVDDITEQVKAATASADSDANALELRSAALKSIEEEYANKAGWEGLRLQTVTFYSGGKFSIYGYKKYDDIRLVLIPENDLGFYGGDPDNFTYPRYNLDCTFWRAYDENGDPVNTSANYFEFNTDGVHDGTPVFVVGNPGRTERYRTTAQLEYDRDHRFKYLLTFLTNRRDRMLSQYDVMKNDEAKVREAQNLLSTINNLSNSIKAYTGIMGGLNNEEFRGRKAQMESKIQKASPGVTYWADLENEYAKLNPHAWAISHLGPSGLRGSAFLLMHELSKYKSALESDASDEDKEAAREAILGMAEGINNDDEKELLTILFNEIQSDIYPGDNTLQRMLDGQSIDAFVNGLFNDSKILKSKSDAEKCLSKDKNVTKSKDPLIKAADILVNRYNESVQAFQGSSAGRRALEAKIANQAFNVYGSSLPPDATFTLRISDGVVKSYEYNGTVAPVKTTYFGMYDRHYSNDKVFPWSLPEKWQNPPMELLSSPLNFVSTNDIIGGNSGSAIINKEGQAVGLIFDGNIESLPGNFIFDEEHNRSVSVHVGGIVAAMKYIYGADRLVTELMGGH